MKQYRINLDLGKYLIIVNDLIIFQGIEQIFLNIAAGLIRLSGESMSTSLKIYDSDHPVGAPSELRATDVGKTEVPSWSIDSIAHGDTEKPYMCC